jgi:hypothetical protein
MILDGAVLAERMFGERLDPREHLVRMYPNAPVPPLDYLVGTAAPLVGRVNHGIWIASCACGARGAPTPGGVVFLDQPVIWCLRCQNGGTGRGWRSVTVPPDEERRRIEAILLCRPNVEDRNWEPGETIADLLAQNAAHGDPVPDVGDVPELVPDWRAGVMPFGRVLRGQLGPRWWQRLAGRR